VSRILRLALLAPDIIEMILEGRSDQALLLQQLERRLHASWETQGDLREILHLFPLGNALPTNRMDEWRRAEPFSARTTSDR
jgi:hypothetical protein